MALINGWYVQVVDETVDNETELSSHAVETGMDVSDHIRNKPVVISLSGNIVDVGDVAASTVLAQLHQFRTAGAMIEYHGRNVQSGLIMTSFNTKHPNTINGGCEFDMELKGLRVAAPSYVETQPLSETETVDAVAQPDPAENPVLEIGAKAVFKGGPVYVSPDASKAAAKRGRSTCTITNINQRDYAAHQYHLISDDGGNVYGWVDVTNIEGLAGDLVKPTRIIGMQQIEQGDNKNVYHLVRLGENVFDLVNEYKIYGATAEWVMENNPDAFDVPGDPQSLKADYNLWVGVRK